MNTTVCGIDFHDEAAASLTLHEKLSVTAAIVLSLAFSGGLAWLSVQALSQLHP